MTVSPSNSKSCQWGCEKLPRGAEASGQWCPAGCVGGEWREGAGSALSLKKAAAVVAIASVEVKAVLFKMETGQIALAFVHLRRR